MGPAGATLKSGSEADTVYVVTITPNAISEGDVTVQVKAGAVQDPALNNNTVSAETDPVHIDTIPPTAEISGVPDIEKNIPFDITITFSEAVNGFALGDIILTGPVTASLTSGSHGDSEYTATIAPNSDAEGDVTLQVVLSAVQDFALNENAASDQAEVYVDTIVPTVQITNVPQNVQLEVFFMKIEFSENMLEFEVEDITLTGDAVVEISELTGSGSVYTLTITPHEDTDGDVAIQVLAGVAKDEAMNDNTTSLLRSVFVAPKWIPDPNIRIAVRDGLGLDEGEDFSREQLSDLTTFDGFYREIYDLTGLEYATDLTSAELTGNFISDLIPLANLTRLTTLMLDNNAITDITAPLKV